MGQFTLHLPKTLYVELDGLAKREGISLNQYIVYTLTQKATAERIAWHEEQLIPKRAKVLDNIKAVPSMQVAEQYEAYAALLSRLGREATDEEVEKYLSEREQVTPEAELEQEAVRRLKESIKAKQAALQ
jgi:hypothetical protein